MSPCAGPWPVRRLDLGSRHVADATKYGRLITPRFHNVAFQSIPQHPSSMPPATTVFNTTGTGGNAQINNINGNVTYMLSEDKVDKIYKWLDAPDSSGNFLAAREKHHEKTGAWFIEGDDYTTWKETPDSALWAYGTSGCGKTVICSTAIEETLLHCSKNLTHACAYFFFDNRDAQTDQALHDKLIRSIIQQLCDQADGVPAPLVELYGNGRQQVSVASLQSTLRKIIDGFERAYIIIDALDECTNRAKVLAWIEELMQWKVGKIHVLFSSRPEQDITDKLRSMAYIVRVTLNSSLADKDIATYLDAMLFKMIGRWSPQTIARVRDVVIKGADGMFRWVALLIEELLMCRTLRAVEDQLQKLPQDLDEMYERALLKSRDQKELKQVLVWLAFSMRPLRLKELADVVTVDFSLDGLPSYDSDRQYFAPSDMLDTCSSFVTELKGTVKLAHMSVKDYLVSERLTNGTASYFSINAMLAHSLIAKTCLAYIFHLRNSRFIDGFLLKSFSLGTYTAQYWIDHMQSGGGEGEHLSQMMHCIFSLEDSALATWVRLDDPDRNSWQRRNWAKPPAEIASPLYYACISGLQRTAQQLMIGGAATNVQEGKYGHALQAASSRGHDAVARLLLEHGADVDVQGGLHGNALQAAWYEGHHTTVRLLLEHGADINVQERSYKNALQATSLKGQDAVVLLLLEHGADAQRGDYGLALQAASSRGQDAIVKSLLKHGADVNVQGGKYGTALQAASSGGHDAMVRLLLEHGADVNAQGGTYESALQAASLAGHTAVIQTLLKHGADVNMQGGKYGTALQAASLVGHTAVVQSLLQHGVDVNVQGGLHENALRAALYGRHHTILCLLLGHGADINGQERSYGNAIRAASFKDQEAIVLLLLEHGADVNAQRGLDGSVLEAASSRGQEAVVLWLLGHGSDVNAEGTYGTALQAASSGGHDAVVRLLLEHGADVNAQGGKYGTALQAASSRAQGSVVLWLLEHGADVNAQGGRYGTALQAASLARRTAVVQLLLEHEADVNAQGGTYGTALQAASSEGRDDMVRSLLDHGADVNAQGGKYGTALQAASLAGRTVVVQLLLEHGADVNAQGGIYRTAQGEKYGTALQAASLAGHTAVVQLLLKHGAGVNAQGGTYESALQAKGSSRKSSSTRGRFRT